MAAADDIARLVGEATARRALAPGPVSSDAPTQSTTTTPSSEYVPLWARGLATGARVLPPVATALSGFGLPLTGLAGAGGEGVAEVIERTFGRKIGGREAFNPKQIVTQGILSAIPVPGGGGVVGQAAKGAALGGVGSAATELAEGRRPTARGALESAIVGAVLGGGAAKLQARGAARATSRRLDDVLTADRAANPLPRQVTPATSEPATSGPGNAFLKVPGLATTPSPARPGPLEAIPPPRPRDAERFENQLGPQVDRLYPSLDDDQRSTLRGILASHEPDLARAAQQTQPVARTQKLAQELVVDTEHLTARTKGEQPLEVEVEALKNHVNVGVQKATELARKAFLNPRDHKAAFAAKGAVLEVQALIEGLTGRAAAAGRTLNILRFGAQAIEKGSPRAIKQAWKLGVPADRLVELLGKFDPEDTVGQYRFIRSLSKPGARDYWRWYWYTSLLSRPKTHERNLIGNTLNLGFKLASRPFAAGLERAQGVPLSQRTVLAGELPHALLAIKKAMPDGFRKALFVMKEGFSMRDVGDFEMRAPEVFGGKFLPNAIGRSLQAADEFFRHLAYSSELHSLAYRDAVKGGGDVAGRMADLLAEPTDKLVKGARDFASRGVFQEQLPPFMASLVRAREQLSPGAGVAADFVLPFVRTPFNILRQGVHASPLGFATQGARQGGRAGKLVQGEAVLGTLLLAPVAWMASQGMISGSGPKDRAVADALYKTGWRPNSIRVPLPGGKAAWVNYGVLQPLTLPFSTVANAFDAYRDTGHFDLEAIGKRTAKSVLDSSFLSGLLDALEFVTDDEGRTGQKFLSRTVQSALPASGALQTIRGVQDPYLREAKSVGEAVSGGLPMPIGDMLGLPEPHPRVRATGELAERGGPLQALLVPEVSMERSAGGDDPSAPQLSPLDQEVGRLHDAGYMKPLPVPSTRTIRVRGKAYPLSSTDQFVMKQAKGTAVRAVLERTIASPEYRKKDDARRGLILTRALAAADNAVNKRAAAAVVRDRPLVLDELLQGVTGKHE